MADRYLGKHADTKNISANTQIGIPKLPSAEKPLFFKVQRRWLQDCDKNHRDCRPNQDDRIPLHARYPTRLIEVSTGKDSSEVRLCETRHVPDSLKGGDKAIRYVALSHPWGDRETHVHYCTTRSNLEDRMRQMSAEELPDTFRDAVRVTRELYVHYLWIDSLCIVQGEDGDFEDEAERMETVFSTAYCVIAASRATGTSDGFLGIRPERKVVTLREEPERSVFLCESIDDFQEDVIWGNLNKRGWVFQERALARRTIYFIETQMYWECGEGVRCETLTRMRTRAGACSGR